MTPVSTRALLWVLENIKNNTEVDANPSGIISLNKQRKMEFHLCNKDGTPIKNCGGPSKPQPTKKGLKGRNFMLLMHTEIKKALCTHVHGQETPYA